MSGASDMYDVMCVSRAACVLVGGPIGSRLISTPRSHDLGELEIIEGLKSISGFFLRLPSSD